mmetsp:Transcript_40988/g.36335  ORF Transcript_40988/g.36335 Transcript_40988/m.36335 type:complete len:88 (-) Transcript_40988:1080-1343(-)|eukprot:CAMPEP_0114584046 /NCGR_PEP_ID=MMETSP0125-20121206/7760_1 /TAXON_ID=485358 ORGANISM="Aristerostoma sp., Strain ATCC 50986" /NCGR_SAMPLE_ID=MMETSP0125 /ASSEMBLY_ACC=CAM_ASM_000245 /LENGTH=87 /DNA_ID=CAMNT_0001778073 /DNA_START=102 /DNA_END=365 /DNA_ORIENTATION=-
MDDSYHEGSSQQGYLHINIPPKDKKAQRGAMPSFGPGRNNSQYTFQKDLSTTNRGGTGRTYQEFTLQPESLRNGTNRNDKTPRIKTE